MLSVAGTILPKSLIDSDLTVVPLFFSSHTTKDKSTSKGKTNPHQASAISYRSLENVLHLGK